MNFFINKYTKETANKLRKMSTCEPKRYWNIIRNINKKNNSADPTPTLDSFYEHFCKRYSLDQTDEEYVPNVETSYVNIDNSALKVQITEEEITEAVNNLKNRLNEYIKGTKENFLPIINTCSMLSLILVFYLKFG